MVNLFTKTVVSFLAAMLLVACSVNYQALPPNSTGGDVGYQEKLLTDGTILLYYYGNSYATDDIIKQYWQKRAGELCPQGYTEIEFSTFKEYGSIRSPVLGRMTTLGSLQNLMADGYNIRPMLAKVKVPKPGVTGTATIDVIPVKGP